ncbi:hypothetical protein FA15DRAFT_666365 [Coprinopsis marcescibilis]|uniref:Nephrocystin 3-like N-terminal domain-containing protein n=1 Tax=Coprinopsis marcescibilis TaxID=230819 RepID=A0A5C3L4B7_COPMA|nr:hypothetical protein FA15DRAFT_666365 [Coprinopsis marcescibilis]
MSILPEANGTTISNSALTAVAGNYACTNQTVIGAIFQSGGTPDGIKILCDYIAVEALHNSMERFDAPRCQEETRTVVQEDIMTWALRLWIAVNDPTLFLWLTGAAGTGKSAIMQTIAEKCDKDAILAASFFFCHRSSERDNTSKFIATLAYQIATNIPAVRKHVAAAVTNDVLIFKKSLEAQMEALIFRPMELAIEEHPVASLNWPKVILIDGLDECKGENHRQHILTVLHDNLASRRLPFRVVLASRPELPMRDFFSDDGIGGSWTRHIVLNESYNPGADIRLYLCSSFALIRAKHCIEISWPSNDAIDALVDKASGHFIYATTVIKFIDDPSCRPKQNLDLILSLKPVNKCNPYAPLDAIYTAILKECPSPKESILTLKIALGLRLADDMDAHRRSSARLRAHDINQFLMLQPSDVTRLFGKLHSLMSIPAWGPEAKSASYDVYHKSLPDFLADISRCGKDLFVSQGTVAEKICLQYLRTWNTASFPGCRRDPFWHTYGFLAQDDIIFEPPGGEAKGGQKRHRFPSMLSMLLMDNLQSSQLRLELEFFDVNSWVTSQRPFDLNLMYVAVHNSMFDCRRFQCGGVCRVWRKAIIKQCKVGRITEASGYHLLKSQFTPPLKPGENPYDQDTFLFVQGRRRGLSV